MKRRTNRYFLGGAANLAGSELSKASGMNPELAGQVGNTAQIATGIATANPVDVVGGAVGMLTSQFSDARSIFKNEDATIKDKFMAVNPFTAAMTANDLQANTQRKDNYAGDIKQRNQAFGLAGGGDLNTKAELDNGFLNEFNAGGTHEENPNGGIPQGVGENGLPNTVEEGETRMGDYIFSDRLTVSHEQANNSGLHRNLGGKTFAEASKILNAGLAERPNEKHVKETTELLLGRLTELNDKANTAIDQKKQLGGKAYFRGGNIKEGDYDIDMSQQEIEYLQSQGYDVTIN